MLSNAYFLAKFRFDTAENEPVKNLQNLAKKKGAFSPSRERTPEVPELCRQPERSDEVEVTAMSRRPLRGACRRLERTSNTLVRSLRNKKISSIKII